VTNLSVICALEGAPMVCKADEYLTKSAECEHKAINGIKNKRGWLKQPAVAIHQ
jgi:hypothetical protein